jgi:hypothetical protein
MQQTPPVTAGEVMNVLAMGDRLRDNRRTSALQQMQDQVEQQAQNMLAGNWLSSGQGQAPAAPAQPAANPLAATPQQGPLNPQAQPLPANPLSGMPDQQPAADPGMFLKAYESEKSPSTAPADTTPSYTDDKYEIKVPGRPTTQWLQKYLSDNNMIGNKQAVQAAMALDADTQKLKQQQEVVYTKQVGEYGALNAERKEQILNIPDEKKRKTEMIKFLEEGKKALANNPVAQRNADTTLDAIKNKGFLPGPNNAFEVELRIPDPKTDKAGYDAAYEKLKPHIPEGVYPTPGMSWKLSGKDKNITNAAEISTGGAIEKTKSDEQLVKGSLKETLGRVPTDTEVLEGLKDLKKEKTRDTYIIRDEFKSKSDARKTGAAGKGKTADYTLPQLQKYIGLNKGALDMEFTKMLDNPNWQTFGKYRGNIDKQEAMLNAFALRIGEWGLTPDQVMAGSKQLKADTKSLISLKTASDAVAQAVGQSEKNAEALRTASANYRRSSYPGPNHFVNWAKKNMSSKEYGQFEVALQAFQKEYMKVTTGAARSVAELSVGAQMSAEQIMSKFDSWEVLEAKIKQAQTEINNSPQSYNKQLRKIEGRIQDVYKRVQGGDQTPADTLPAGVTQDAIAAELARRKGK